MEPIPEGMVVDHLIHPLGSANKIDNRKCNLQIKTPQQNSMNQAIRTNNRSGVPGVTFRDGKWIARIGYKMKRISLGSYDNFEEAVKARIDAEEKYWGEFSYRNISNQRKE
jgi:hypothetical protein